MLARVAFTLAVQMQAVVMGWMIYELTGDPLALGFVGLVEAIPALSLALFAGYLVDQHHPVRIYRAVLCGSLLSSLILFCSVHFGTALPISTQVSTLYFASVITGTARAFSQPCIYAIVPKLVPREDLTIASAWMASSMQAARIVGPALGGLVFGFFGADLSFLIISIFLILGLGFWAWVHIETPSVAPRTAAKSLWSELFSGADFVFRHRILLPALTLDMVSVMFGGVTALLPIYAKEILMVGPKGLGILRAGPAVGAVLMSVFMIKAAPKRRAGTWLLTSVAGFGVSIFVFALSKNFYLSFAALMASGIFDSASMVIRNTVVQLASPSHLRGRISAVNSMFIGSSNELGEFESGIAAKLLGPVPAAYFGAIACLLTVGIMTLLSPELRKLDLDQI